MDNTLHTLFPFFLFFFLTSGHGQAQQLPPKVKSESTTSSWKEPTPSSETEWTIWKGEGFQISYPPKWYTLPLEVPNSLVGFFSPKDSENDFFKECVSIYKTDVVFKGSTAELGHKMEQFVKEQNPEAKLVSSKLIVVNNVEAAELTFTGSFGENSKSRLVIFSTNRAIYTVDLLYEPSAAEKYENLFDQLVKTIQIF